MNSRWRHKYLSTIHSLLTLFDPVRNNVRAFSSGGFRIEFNVLNAILAARCSKLRYLYASVLHLIFGPKTCICHLTFSYFFYGFFTFDFVLKVLQLVARLPSSSVVVILRKLNLCHDQLSNSVELHRLLVPIVLLVDTHFFDKFLHFTVAFVLVTL